MKKFKGLLLSAGFCMLLLIAALIFPAAKAQALTVWSADYYSTQTDLQILSQEAEQYSADGKDEDIITVPLRAVCEYLGAYVEWKSPNVTVIFNGKEISLGIGSKTAYIDGEKYTLAAAPYLKNNRTMIPVDFLREALKCKIYTRYSAVYVFKMPYPLPEEDKARFFDLAFENRFDYLPEFSRENAPELNDFLMFLLINGYADENGVIDKNTAENTARQLFGVSLNDMRPKNEYQEATFGKYWQENDTAFIPQAHAYNGCCLYDLVEYNAYEGNGLYILEIAFLGHNVDELLMFGPSYEINLARFNENPDSVSRSMRYIMENKGEEITAGMTPFEAAREMIIEGKTAMFEVRHIVKIKLQTDSEGNIIRYLQAERPSCAIIGRWEEI